MYLHRPSPSWSSYCPPPRDPRPTPSSQPMAASSSNNYYPFLQPGDADAVHGLDQLNAACAQIASGGEPVLDHSLERHAALVVALGIASASGSASLLDPYVRKRAAASAVRFERAGDEELRGVGGWAGLPTWSGTGTGGCASWWRRGGA